MLTKSSQMESMEATACTATTFNSNLPEQLEYHLQVPFLRRHVQGDATPGWTRTSQQRVRSWSLSRIY